MNKEQKCQTSEILNHLIQGKTITQLEATKLCGCLRLSSIIFHLRRKGYNIVTEQKNIKNRYGDTSSIGVYHLES